MNPSTAFGGAVGIALMIALILTTIGYGAFAVASGITVGLSIWAAGVAWRGKSDE